MRIKTTLAIAATMSLCAFAPAQASTFVFEGDDLGGKLDVGQHANIRTTYDTDSEVFTWSSTFRRDAVNGSGRLAQGGWLVINEGGMPSDIANEYPIFYIDGLEERVSLYNYDGKINERSYQNESFLDSLHLDVTEDAAANERTFAFSYDASALNSRTDLGDDWKGVGFGEEVGIWLHGVDELTTSYDGEQLKDFTFRKQGWYDVEFIPTKSEHASVPEPGTVAALGIFAAAAVSKLRNRTA